MMMSGPDLLKPCRLLVWFCHLSLKSFIKHLSGTQHGRIDLTIVATKPLSMVFTTSSPRPRNLSSQWFLLSKPPANEGPHPGVVRGSHVPSSLAALLGPGGIRQNGLKALVVTQRFQFPKYGGMSSSMLHVE